jgi:hypothetical protein
MAAHPSAINIDRIIGGVFSFFIPHHIRSGKNIKRCMRSHGLGFPMEHPMEHPMSISYTKYTLNNKPNASTM